MLSVVPHRNCVSIIDAHVSTNVNVGCFPRAVVIVWEIFLGIMIDFLVLGSLFFSVRAFSINDVSVPPSRNRTKSVSSTKRQLAQSPSCAYLANIERCPRRQRATPMRVAITKRLSSR